MNALQHRNIRSIRMPSIFIKSVFRATRSGKQHRKRITLRHPAHHFDAVCDGGVFVGEILYWGIGDALYIEHFCVLPSMRNKHYGQKILAALQKQPLILEIDPPVGEISRRRKGFFERCGFVENPYPHTHPPYHEGFPSHDLVVMSSPKALRPEEYESFRHALCNMVMRKVF